MTRRRADRYPEIGPKEWVPDLWAAQGRVRAVYPKAACEGSTGPERTFWINGPDGQRDCIAHTWPRARNAKGCWLRMRPLQPAQEHSK